MADIRSRQLERLVERAPKDPEVLAVLLFGSTAGHRRGARSDIDVCLVLGAGSARGDRMQLSRKRLEYLKDFDLDVQIFQDLPIFIRHRVLKEGKVLFVRNEDLLYEIAYRTAQAFEDFRHTYHRYLEQVAGA